MGSELTFWAFHKDPPKEVEKKDQEFLKNKRNRADSVTVSSPTAEASSESQSNEPAKIEKRRFSLDFFLPRKGSKGKVKIGDKRGSTSSTDSGNYAGQASNQRRRSSTRMEGNSEIAAWCIV